MSRSKQAPERCPYKPGDRIRHEVFGLGTVESVPSGWHGAIRITFDDGAQRVLQMSFVAGRMAKA